MITFLTVFLGIAVGVVDVSFLVSSDVASVQLRLDDRPVGTVRGAPWTLSCDLGPDPAPQELVAVAYDRSGREIGRAKQWINMPRPAAELDVVLRRTSDGSHSIAVSWESIKGKAPSALRATLNGVNLDTSSPSRIRLPALDSARVNFLRVEADFPEAGSATREIVFGGYYVEHASADLSSVAVVLPREAAEKPLKLRHQSSGKLLPVVGLEKGPADLVIVLDPRARSAFPGLTVAPGSARGNPLMRAAAGTDKGLTPRPPDVNLRVLWPVPREAARKGEAAGRVYGLFASTGADSPPDAGGLLWHVAGTQFPATRGRVQLADAVAVAGKIAIERGRRRAVLLVLGGSPNESTHTVEGVRSYLEKLRVPLVVWSTRRPREDEANGWGTIHVVDGPRDLAVAWARLLEALERQRVAWVEGAHLPHLLEVADTSATVAGIAERREDAVNEAP